MYYGYSQTVTVSVQNGKSGDWCETVPVHLTFERGRGAGCDASTCDEAFWIMEEMKSTQSTASIHIQAVSFCRVLQVNEERRRMILADLSPRLSAYAHTPYAAQHQVHGYSCISLPSCTGG